MKTGGVHPEITTDFRMNTGQDNSKTGATD